MVPLSNCCAFIILHPVFLTSQRPAQTRSQLKPPGGSAASSSRPATNGGGSGGGSLNLNDLRKRLDRLKGTSAT